MSKKQIVILGKAIQSFIRNYSFLLICCLIITDLFSQQNQLPYVRQYPAKAYKASVSNHAIEIDSSGIIYFGNHDGLLTFDGNNWELTNIADGKPAYSLAIVDNKIFIGSNNEFGYITIEQTGLKKYTSLSTKIDPREFSLVFSTTGHRQEIYFTSLNYIFRYAEEEIKTWEIKNAYMDFGGVFIHDERPYFFQNTGGLYMINDNDDIEPVDDMPNNERILGEFDEQEKTLLSQKGRLYRIEQNSIKEHYGYNTEIQNILSQGVAKNLVIDKIVDENIYTIGTRKNGIYTIRNNQILYHLNYQNGLTNDESRELIIIDNDLWQVTQRGINNIQNYRNWSFYGAKNGINGLIWDIIRYNNNIYIATSEALHKVNKGKVFKINRDGNKLFNSFFINDNRLLTNTSSGIYSVSVENKTQPLNHLIALENSYTSIDIDGSSMLNISRSGTHIIYNDNNNFTIDSTLSTNLSGISHSYAKLNNDYYVSLINSGIIYADSTLKITKFDKRHGLPSIKDPYIFVHDNKVLIATESGFYRKNENPKSDSSDFFIPDYSIIKERFGISMPVEDSKGNIWYVATNGKFDSNIEKLELQTDGSYIKISRPFKWLPQQEFTKIYPDPVEEGIIWIAGTEGLYRYDDNVEVDYDTPFNTLVRKVYTGDSLIFGGTYFNPTPNEVVPSMLLDQPDAFKPTLSYDFNKISFQFTATSYDAPEKNEYSYFLKGNDEYWSSWNSENKKEYTNLDPGTYTFMVKSKNIYDTEGRTATYEFTILPPWYMTTWSKFLFGLIGLIGIWLMIRLYTYRLRLQRQKLKLMVADRTFEVMQKSKKIEKQNHLLTEQTEEIKQQRDDIQEKNQELQSSQEEILAINHKLAKLNNHLEKEVESRTKKIKTTIEKLQKTNSELDTFVYRASHDLKSSISRIMGLSTLAKLEIPDSEYKEYFNLIELAANDMKNLLAKLTHVHELFNKNVQFKEIDVPTLLGSIRASLKHLDQNNDTQYSFNIKNILSLKNDEDIIRIIMENLIENALIFKKTDTDQRHHIKIEVFEKGNMVHIKVSDNGVGINNEHFEQLFDMFFRASDQSKGNGLGLYLVKMSVEKLKGIIVVESTPNESTEFTVQLPIN